MNVDAFVEEMLRINIAIRYVAVVDNEYNLLVSSQRPGTPSFTTEESDRNFMSIIPPIIVEAVDKLRPFLGAMEAFRVRYKKALLMFHRAGNLIVVLSFGPQVTTPFLSEVTKQFEKLKEEYLT